MMLLPAYTPRLPGRITCEDALSFFRAMPDESVNCIITSPPYYGLRDYGVPGQLGMEATPAEYVARLVAIFHEARRVLRKDGTFWLNLGDSYSHDSKWGGQSSGKQQYQHDAGALRGHVRLKKASGLPDKNLLMIPARVAIALQDDGWVLRSEIIWAKPAPMPESVKDRPTRSHEMVYLLTRSASYRYDADAIAEPAQDRRNGKYHNPGTGLQPHSGLTGKPKMNGGGFSKAYADAQPEHGGESVRKPYLTRNKRDVWTVTPANYSESHFATFPPKLIEPMILAGCPVGGVVCDPFAGTGTTGAVAQQLGRRYIMADLNPAYIDLAYRRLSEPFTLGMFLHTTSAGVGK